MTTTCAKCGATIENPGNYCPNCAAPLPGNRQAAQEAEEAAYDYVTFGGMAPRHPEDPNPGGIGLVGLLRALGVLAVVAGFIVALASNGTGWEMYWGTTGLIFFGGFALGAVLFLAAWIVKRVKKKEK